MRLFYLFTQLLTLWHPSRTEGLSLHPLPYRRVSSYNLSLTQRVPWVGVLAPISQPMLCCVAGGAGGGLVGQHACLEGWKDILRKKLEDER